MDADDAFSEEEDLEILLERNADRNVEEDVDDPLEENTENNTAGSDGNANDNENAETTGDNTNKKKAVTAKKIVRNPQPKLNADRICGKQGISLLPKVFENTKFKGKGYEKDDLNKMMGILEHWAHRLFPKLPFDTVLDRIERLGSKKQVQVYVKKMRMDMLFEEDDRPIVDSDDENNANSSKAGNDTRSRDKVFEELLRESPFDPSTDFYGDTHNTVPMQQPVSVPTYEASPLSEELRQKVERNRQLALEKKRARESQCFSSAADASVAHSDVDL